MLREEIDLAKRSVSTDVVSITLGEVANMYGQSELNIIPEFQRLFRWEDEKKSSFIESILIGIPIPPAFVYESQEGSWELIDGLQRISTILEFMGLLKDPDSGNPRRSSLIGTKYLPSLAGVVWKAQSPEETQLDLALQLFFRRHRIDFQILKYPSDPKTKFDLFQRLNRGGAYANEQEVRTCSMVLTDAEKTRKIREICSSNAFQKIFRITEEQKKQQKDIDYATRVMVHSFRDLPKRWDVQAFLDRGIVDILSTSEADIALDRLSWAVNVLYRLFGDEALIPPDERAEGIAARFSLRALEGIVVGLARNMSKIALLPDSDSFIRSRVTEFWLQGEVADMSASGLRGTVRLQRSVPFGAKWFDPRG